MEWLVSLPYFSMTMTKIAWGYRQFRFNLDAYIPALALLYGSLCVIFTKHVSTIEGLHQNLKKKIVLNLMLLTVDI
jgi:hypothetical protein